MSGNQFTLVSRVAWCDVHFVKVNFVEKRQHHSESMQDEFSITTLGIRELNRRADKLTVGYLRGFYMGNVHRGAGSDDTTSAVPQLSVGRYWQDIACHEKASHLAESGLRTLFVCYNNNLVAWIKSKLQHDLVDVMTFHSLVGHIVQRARIPMSRIKNWVDFNAIDPDVLVDATNVLHAPDANPDLLYDAIIVDEGQDFEDTWWIGLLDILKDPEAGIFFDDNQRIFTNA